MGGMRILLATDGSAGSDEAVSLLASSVEPDLVERVEVLSVVAPVGPPPGPGSSRAVLEASRRDGAERSVRAAAERLRAAGFEVDGSILEGHPADAIVERATVERPGLVILGTRGLSGWQRRLAGSVSTKVARYAPVPVLVARNGGPVRRILLGYDASPDAERALALVVSLPWREAVEVTVCSTFDVPRPLLSGVAPTMVAEVHAAYRDVSRWAREAAEVMASDAARRLAGLGLAATARSVRGKAHEQLAIVASELPADLLVVGSRGLSAIQRFFLGSTSARLLSHPPTSVLVVRDEEVRA